VFYYEDVIPKRCYCVMYCSVFQCDIFLCPVLFYPYFEVIIRLPTATEGYVCTHTYVSVRMLQFRMPLF
jgi:ABC-type amino acid transport system permease subunit